jgi:hypothetical protein
MTNTKREKLIGCVPHQEDIANKIVGRDAYIERLKNGETVAFGEPGNSMDPIIKHRQKCVYAPVGDPGLLERGQVVFCKVGPFHYTHMIKQIRHESGEWMFLICRRDGRENGWTPLSNVYGKVIEVLPTSVTQKQIDVILRDYNAHLPQAVANVSEKPATLLKHGKAQKSMGRSRNK